MAPVKSNKCPICRAVALSARDENPAFPFCSERCRLIDLGNWLGEGYRVPAEPVDGGDGGDGDGGAGQSDGEGSKPPVS